MMQYAVTVQNLGVGYDGRCVLDRLSFSITRGEVVALIGPNGAGKSTLLKSLCRQLQLISGDVTLLGDSLQSLGSKDLARRVSVLLTDRIRPELMTCREVVAMGRYPYTGRMGLLSAEDQRLVDEAMDAAGVTDLAERDFGAISDGQRQRVLLARAICQQPEILMLDEPTGYLDVRHKLELLSLLRRMAHDKGVTVIMSLHEIDLAQKAADRLLCVRAGEPLIYGAPDEIFTGDRIGWLYDLSEDTYDPLFGGVELAKVEGTPRAFVISSGGTGIPVYRTLQRQGEPFAAGILYTNDIDYHLAKRLAVQVVTEAPFSPISDAALAQARALMGACDRVIDAGFTCGPYNKRMEELIMEAKALGKYERA